MPSLTWTYGRKSTFSFLLNQILNVTKWAPHINTAHRHTAINDQKGKKKLVRRERWSVRWTLRQFPCWFAIYCIKLSLLKIYKMSFWMRIKATTTSLLWYKTLHWACDEPFLMSLKAAFHNLTVFHSIPCILPHSCPLPFSPTTVLAIDINNVVLLMISWQYTLTDASVFFSGPVKVKLVKSSNSFNFVFWNLC